MHPCPTCRCPCPCPSHPVALQVGLKYGLPLLSPVDDGGVFTEEAGPFVGLQVQGDGNEAVVQVGSGGALSGTAAGNYLVWSDI